MGGSSKVTSTQVLQYKGLTNGKCVTVNMCTLHHIIMMSLL